MSVRRLLPIVAFLLPLLAGASDVRGASATGTRHDVVFTQYYALSRSSEMILRLLSPQNAGRVTLEGSLPGHAVRQQSVDLSQE